MNEHPSHRPTAITVWAVFRCQQGREGVAGAVESCGGPMGPGEEALAGEIRIDPWRCGTGRENFEGLRSILSVTWLLIQGTSSLYKKLAG